MSCILDASIALAWCFKDERTPAVDAVLDRVKEAGAVVPGLWRLEVGNGLQIAIRRKRIDVAYRDAALNDLTGLDISTDAETDARAWSAILRMAERYRLTLYDAAYPELALRFSLPLATLDEELRTASRLENIGLLGIRL